jgi:hypothetical protein
VGCLSYERLASSDIWLESGDGAGQAKTGEIMAEPGSVEFSIGRVIGDSFGVFARNFVSFSILALLIGLINLAYALINIEASIEAATTGQPDLAGSAIRGVLGMLVGSLTQAAIIFGTFQDLRGQKAGVGECIARGLTAMLPVIVASILFSLAMVIGLFLLIVPGVIILLMWWVYVPAIVVEGKGIFGSFGRSAELTKGRRWRILGLLLVVFVIIIIVYTLIGVFSTLGLFAFASDPLVGFIVVEYVLTALLAAFTAVLAAVSYYYLRAEKEGIDVNEIARVFD